MIIGIDLASKFHKSRSVISVYIKENGTRKLIKNWDVNNYGGIIKMSRTKKIQSLRSLRKDYKTFKNNKEKLTFIYRCAYTFLIFWKCDKYSFHDKITQRVCSLIKKMKKRIEAK